MVDGIEAKSSKKDLEFKCKRWDPKKSELEVKPRSKRAKQHNLCMNSEFWTPNLQHQSEEDTREAMAFKIFKSKEAILDLQLQNKA